MSGNYFGELYYEHDIVHVLIFAFIRAWKSEYENI